MIIDNVDGDVDDDLGDRTPTNTLTQITKPFQNHQNRANIMPTS